MMLRFRGATLLPVLKEAQSNKCQVILVKDEGVYFMSQIGEKDHTGRHKLLCYADGCNPETESFDDWWELSRQECGGDDFGEFFDLSDDIFQHLLKGGNDLFVIVTDSEIRLHIEANVPHSH
ncbi:DUF3085 domain-containing protein [Pseudomonas chlororaphis]|nr:MULTISPECIES: DUF3085 domain-containing protein [Pseudomonas]WJV27622.1 DUF3085 domain-containing protein [Pseudomonas chlororaphis]